MECSVGSSAFKAHLKNAQPKNHNELSGSSTEQKFNIVKFQLKNFPKIRFGVDVKGVLDKKSVNTVLCGTSTLILCLCALLNSAPYDWTVPEY